TMNRLMEDMLPLEVTPKEGKSQAELTDESQVLLKVPRKNNMYSVDLKNIVPKGGLTYLFVKATSDEYELWHRRLGHINFKTMNKLVKGNLVRGIPSKLFENDQTYVACQKGKQHRASYKSKTVSSISQPLHMLHMDLFGPTFVKSLMKKMYCLVVTDDYSRFSWVFFLATKDETSGILKSFITRVENLIDQKVKVKLEWRQFTGKDLHYATLKVDEDPRKDSESIDQEKDDNVNSTNNVKAASTNEVNVVGRKTSIELPDDLNMPALEDIVYSNDDEDVGAEADMNNLDTTIQVSPIPTTRIHKDHPVEQIIGDLNSAPQTRRMTKNLEEHVLQRKKPLKDFQNACLPASYQKTLVDLPNGKRPIGTKWVFRNKKDERGIVIKNKARLVAQGYTQEEGIDYDEVFAPVARIEAIRLFLAYASFKDFVVYQMDVKSAFLYGKIEEEDYVYQLPGFEDPDFPDRRRKIEKTLFIKREKGLQVKQKEDGIFIIQDKYVTEILKKFGFTDVKTASTPMETQKLLLKDEDGEEVDVHLHISMIGSLMYLTSSRSDIMFAVCACARYQVNLKVSHLHAIKMIFRYLKGQPKLGLWYLKDLPFDLVAYTDSDYVGASLDRKSTTGVNDVRHNLLLLLKVNAARHNLLLLLKVNAARHKLTTTATIKVKTVNGEVQLQALVDGKKIIVTEVSFRRDLQLNDEEGTDCLPNATIFEELTRIRYGKLLQKLTFYKAFFSPRWKFLIHTILQCLSAKTTAWNEFSSTMASAIICLATNQKFNFSKYIFESLVKNLENVSGKFLMYLRFKHEKGGERLFWKKEMGKGSANPTDPHHTPTIIQLSTSQPQKKQKPRKPKRKDTEVPQPSGPIDNVTNEAVNDEMDCLTIPGTGPGSGPSVPRNCGDPIAQLGINLVSTHFDADTDMFGVHDLVGDEVVVETEVASKDVNLSVDEVTLAQALAALKSAKPKADKVMLQEPEHGTITTTAATTVTATSIRPKAKGLVIHEQEQAPTPTVSSQQPSQLNVQDKGKGKMVKQEPVKKLSKKDQLMLDEELAFKLQAKEEDERLAR
ncbi:putative ribonuclease H-like domain-containing protein, partial [Tanacetum coccineum]